jgi:predicted RNA-binding protein with PUA-like domain
MAAKGRSHWLVKSEPTVYAWADLVRDGRTCWDGVRNFQARNNLAAMKVGDRALYYHSVGDREVVGIAEVAREAYPDPTADEPRWVAVDVTPAAALARPVSLAAIKEEPALAGIALVRQSRLSVVPLDAAAFQKIVAMGGGERPLA